jgi:hypothetical protein
MRTGRLFLATVALCLLPSLAMGAVSGTSTVDYGTGEFAGYWCYTIEFSWDTPQSLSNLSSFIGLEGLACACLPGIFVFPTPAGTTTGVENGVECTLEYIGEYLCTGNPSLPPEFAGQSAVKWDPAAPETCNAGSTGTGTVTFYSLLAPGADEVHPGVLVIKSGVTAIFGDVTGPLPAADCNVEHGHDSMGAMKSRFDH